jgi:hypothetical protein
MDESACISFIPDITSGLDQSRLAMEDASRIPIESAIMPITRYPIMNPPPNKPKKIPS